MGLFFDYFNSGLRWTLIEKIGPVRVLVQGAASALDEARNALVWIRNQFNPGTTTDTASIESFAASRGIVRLPEEPYDYYLARLINAFMWYRQGGTEPSLAEVLRLCGYDTIKVTNCRDIDPERWAEFIVDIIPDPDDVLTSEAALLDMISIVKPARSKCAGVRFAVHPSPALIHMGAICITGLVVTIPPYIPASPVLLSATIGVDGNSLTLVFDRPMTRGPAHVTSDLNIDIENVGTDIPLTYLSGDGSDAHVYKPGTTVRKNEVVDFDYNGRLDGYVDDDGNSLEAVLNLAVINDSEEDYSDIVFWDGFEGALNYANRTYESTNYDYPTFHTGSIDSDTDDFSLTTYYKKVGVYSLWKNSTASGTKRLRFPISAISRTCGRIGFWLKQASTGNGIWVALRNTTNLNNYIKVARYNVTGTVEIVNRYQTTESGTLTAYDPASLYVYTTGNKAWDTNFHFYELAWDNLSFGVRFYRDGSLMASDAPNAEWFGTFDEIIVGNGADLGGTTAVAFYIDNLIASTDPNRDLYALALLEACPRV